ncbi:MAG: hypothetical protein SFY32_12685 [Bacteroidota bacterium]|nr:hypothetical protein [Bacteroidota bacterium]
MKYILLIIISICTTVSAQDIITKTNGEDIKAKVIEVGTNEIRYKKFDDTNGPTFIISKSEILIIKYENGTKDVFQNSNPNNQITQNEDNNSNSFELYNKGISDAQKYYVKYKEPATWAFVSGCAGGLIIPPVIMMISEPEQSNLGYPDKQLFSKDNYRRGYIDQAKKIKTRKVWTNWGIGTGICFGAGCVGYVSYVALVLSLASR